MVVDKRHTDYASCIYTGTRAVGSVVSTLCHNCMQAAQQAVGMQQRWSLQTHERLLQGIKDTTNRLYIMLTRWYGVHDFQSYPSITHNHNAGAMLQTSSKLLQHTKQQNSRDPAA